MNPFIFLLLFLTSLFAEESSFEEIAAFRNENELIAGLVSPLTGQIIQNSVDLTVTAQEPLHFLRFYTPRATEGHELFDDGCLSWRFIPYLKAGQYGKNFDVYSYDGRCIRYHASKKNLEKLSLRDPKILRRNTDGQEVHARFDPHNIHSQFLDEDHLLFVTPEGIKRIYKKKFYLITHKPFYLVKEILPNGKHINYKWKDKDKHLVGLESTDQSGYCIYASMSFKHSKDNLHAKVRSSLGHKVDYFCKARPNPDSEHYLNHITFSDRPTEENSYHLWTFLKGQKGRGQDFTASYNTELRIKTLELGNSLYQFSYQDKATTVTYPEGSKSIHLFNDHFQPTKVSFYDQSGALRKERLYTWEETGRILSIENVGLSRIEYVSDHFGNPILETVVGDLTGNGEQESYPIKRIFSGKDPDQWFLLLHEEAGDIATDYTYIPSTNLLASKITRGKDGLTLKEERRYDLYYNLLEILVEADGEKRITRIRPKPTPPALHQPEWIEEYYVESGVEKLLKKSHFFYNGHNLISREEVYDSNDAFVYHTEKTYDERDLLLSETNPLGQKAHYTYDLHHRLLSHEPFSKRLTETKTYDLKGRLASTTIAGKTTTYQYDRDDNLLLETNPFGHEKRYSYDLIAKKPRFCRFGDREDRFTYDGYGRMLSKTDSLGRTTSYRYTAYDKISHITHPDGLEETFRYYKNGALKEHVDREGLLTSYTYDSFGRLISKKWADGEESWAYNALHLLSHTDRAGYTTYYRYNPAGQRVEEERCGRLILYSYDSLGRLASETRGGITTTTKKDLLGRVVSETKGDLYTKEIEYDEEGNQKTITVGDTREEFVYDEQKRVVKHIGPLGEESNFSYQEGALCEKRSVDPSGLVTIEIFDIHGSLLERRLEKDGTLFRERKTYDPVGNLLKHEEDIFEGTDYKKTLINSYSYDLLNRLISSTLQARTTKFTYTPNGKLRTKEKPDGTLLRYTYTPSGEVATLSSSQGDIDHQFTYDKLGRLLSGTGFVRKLDPFGNVLEESFDHLTVYRTYDDFDRVTSLTLPGLSPILYTYDLYLRSVAYEDAKRAYTKYNLAGHLLEESYASYKRDKKGQIKELTTSKFTQTCTYDPVGNPLQIGSTHYTYSPLSQLLSEKDPLYFSHYSFNSHYDDTSQPEKKEPNDPIGTYDSLDRLIACNGATYTYDALDRRLSKNHERFLYTGFEEIACYRGDTPLAVKIGPPHRPAFFLFHHLLTTPLYDAKESLSLLIHPKTDHIYNQYLFNAFGTPIEVIETISNPWGFALKHHDRESGLIYFGKRYYNPDTRQWITPDPAGNLDTLNLYTFVRNNPIRYVDYAGLLSSASPLFNFHKTQNYDSCTYTVGTNELPPDKLIIFVNGIDNNLEFAKETATLISAFIGNSKVVGVHNPTNGPLNDILLCFSRLKSLLANEVTHNLLPLVRDFHNINQANPNAKIFMINHSGGAIEGYILSKYLAEEENKRIIMKAFAPGKIITNDTFYSSSNYGVRGDPVVHFAILREPQHENQITWLDNIKGEDKHSIRNKMFQAELDYETNQYLKGNY